MTRIWLRRLRALAKERRAVALIELALIGPTFLIALVVLFNLTYLFTAQMLLNYALESVARSIQTGQAQTQTTQQNFTANVLCPALLVLSCNNLLINIQPVSDWYSVAAFTVPVQNGQVNSSGLNFCNGNPGQLLQVNVVYLAPVLLPFVTGTVTFNGGAVFPLYAAAAFADEQFPAITGMSSPC